MRRAGVPSTHHERPAGVACRFQFAENPVDAASADARDVLICEPTGSHLSHQPHGFKKQSGALAIDAAPLRVRRAGVLAGRASDNGVDGAESGQRSSCEGANVIEHHHVGPVVGEYGAPPRIGLARRDRFPAGAMKSQSPAAGSAAEKVQASHAITLARIKMPADRHSSITSSTDRHTPTTAPAARSRE